MQSKKGPGEGIHNSEHETRVSQVFAATSACAGQERSLILFERALEEACKSVIDGSWLEADEMGDSG